MYISSLINKIKDKLEKLKFDSKLLHQACSSQTSAIDNSKLEKERI